MGNTPPPRGSAAHPTIQRSRSIAKAVSWRIVGSVDTWILSFVLITYLGPSVGLDKSNSEAASTASWIALTEVITKIVLFYLHERFWEWNRWGTTMSGLRIRESWSRTTIKTATWRVAASLDTVLLAWLFTGNLKTAISIGGLEVMTKLLLYFLHERAWARVRYGIVPPNQPAAIKCETGARAAS